MKPEMKEFEDKMMEMLVEEFKKFNKSPASFHKTQKRI